MTLSQRSLPRSDTIIHIVVIGLLLMPGWSQVAVATEDQVVRGPDVTIIAQEDRTVFEYRQGGELRMIKVVPKWGKPYYLVPGDRTKNFGDLERAETLLPSWVIIEF